MAYFWFLHLKFLLFYSIIKKRFILWGILHMAEKKLDKTADKKVSDKQKALEAAISQIEKQFGSGSVMVLGQNSNMEVDAISTGSFSLDLALGIGGVPKGRIVEIYGPESSGKTTVALHVVAQAQKPVEPPLLLMRSMHWILFMQDSLV